MDETRISLGTPGREFKGLDVITLEAAIDHWEAVCTEFTCLCPVTKQPDHAVVSIRLGPTGKVIETKSLKLYLETYRNVGVFHENLASRVLKDVREALAGAPEYIVVEAKFNTRGGISVQVSTGMQTTYAETPLGVEGPRE